MRVIQERVGSPTVSYTRGSDLSGSLEGAGGIGDLLARSHGYASSNGNWYVHNCYHADGNGNITYLVNSSQTLAASYRYDPYGNTISSSGSLASANVYRFSSKEIHVNSGLYYYGYRWYAPNLQRWLNRDPIEELGGINLYNYVLNNPINHADRDGLVTTAFCAAFAGYLAAALRTPDFSDASLAALHALYQAMCGKPPHTPLPGRPFDFVRGTPPPDPFLNRGYLCPSPLYPSLQRRSVFAHPGLTVGTTVGVAAGVTGGAIIASRGRLIPILARIKIIRFIVL
jgi:RHS repeat-associated protein